MKRLLFTGLVSCFLGFSTFAAGKDLPDALNAFYKTFRNAQNVSWTEVDDMLRIGFTMNDQQRFAYYSSDDLIVVATEIKSEQLPENLRTQLSDYKGYTVTQVYSLVKNNVKEYCVVMQGHSKPMVLKGKNKWKVCIGRRI